MKYQIQVVEEVEAKTGKAYKRATITDEQGITSEVSVWPDFPEYDKVIEGSEVSGQIRVKGQYKNLVSLEARSFKPKSDIQQAVAHKENMIKKATDRKELSMRHFAARRTADTFFGMGWLNMNESEKEKAFSQYWNLVKILEKADE